MKQRPKYNSAPPSGERLIIIKNNIQTELPYRYAISHENISIRAKSEKRAFAHGGTLVGDGYVDSKKLKISIDVKGKSQEEHDELLNSLTSLFMGRDYKLINGRTDSYYNVASLESVKPKFIKGYQNRWSDIDVSLLMTDPFRYAIGQTTIEQNFASSSENVQFLLSNDGSMDTPLLIEVIPTKTMPSVEIKHVQTGQSCKVTDSLLAAPKTLKISSVDGTVLRGEDENAINAFSGMFLSAAAGANTYLVSCSGAGKIKITYQSRWLI